jgi:hypothetical protein
MSQVTFDILRRLRGATINQQEADELITAIRERTAADDAERDLAKAVAAAVDEYMRQHGKLHDAIFTRLSSAIMSRLEDGRPERHRAVMKAFRATAIATDAAAAASYEHVAEANGQSRRGDYPPTEPHQHGVIVDDGLVRGPGGQRIKPYSPPPTENPSFYPAGTRRLMDNPQA